MTGTSRWKTGWPAAGRRFLAADGLGSLPGLRHADEVERRRPRSPPLGPRQGDGPGESFIHVYLPCQFVDWLAIASHACFPYLRPPRIGIGGFHHTEPPRRLLVIRKH